MTRCLVELSLASSAPAVLKSQSLHVLSAMLNASRTTQEMLSGLLICPLLAIETPQYQEPLPEEPQEPQYGPDGKPIEAPPPPPPEPLPPLISYTRLPARPAVLALLGTALHGPSLLEAGTPHAQLGMRAAALSCFNSLVSDNIEVRSAIIDGMMPEEGQSGQDAPMTAGLLLMDALRGFPAPDATIVAESNGEKSGFDAYKHLFASLLFAQLVKGSNTAKKAVRNIAIDHEGKVTSRNLKEGEHPDEDDPRSGLIQILIGNLTMAMREQSDAVRKDRTATASGSIATGASVAADWTRVVVGYLVLLSLWLWDSPFSVRDMLSESANLQVLIQPAAQSSGIDPLVQSLCAFVLGLAYEFNTDAGPDGLNRETMHPILHSRIGADNFGVRLLRLRDDLRFRTVGPDVLERVGDDPALAKEERQDGLWVDWSFVEFWKNNFLMAQRSVLVEPQSTSKTAAGASAELLDARRQVDALKDQTSKQSHEIEHLEQNLANARKELEESKASHADAISKARDAHQASEESLVTVQKDLSTREQAHEAALQEVQKAKETVAVELDGVKEALAKAEARCEELQKRAEQAEAETQALQKEKEAAASSSGTAATESEAAEKQMQAKLEELEKKLSEAEQKAETAAKKTQEAEAEASKAKQQAADAEDKATKAAEASKSTKDPKAGGEGADAASKERLTELEKENEDLLVLLEELSTKRKADKAKMREKGLDVSDDDDDDDDEDEEDEE